MTSEQLEFDFGGRRPNPDSILEVGQVVTHHDHPGGTFEIVEYWSPDDLWEVENVETGYRFLTSERDIEL
jgi:hypothetical protein